MRSEARVVDYLSVFVLCQEITLAMRKLQLKTCIFLTYLRKQEQHNTNVSAEILEVMLRWELLPSASQRVA